MNEKINLAIVDDECLFGEGLALLFANNDKIVVSNVATGGLEFLAQLKNSSTEEFPEVALVDIQMKPMDGFELVERLKVDHPELKIIILSSHYKKSIYGYMIKLGVSAFLPKNSNKEVLIKAIESVYQTGVFFSEKDHEMLASCLKSNTKKYNLNFGEVLTEREKEVVKFICLQYTNQEIAEKLFLSKRTVEGHRQRILDKINAKNTVGLVLYAISHEIFIPKISI